MRKTARRVVLRDRGIAVEPPAGWQMVDFGPRDPTHGVKFVSPDGAAAVVLDLPALRRAFEDHVRAYRASLGEMFAGAEVGEPAEITVADRRGVRFTLSSGAPGTRRTSDQVLVPIGERVLTAYFHADEAVTASHREALDALLASLEIL